jgi:hypothetical protein
MIEYKLFGENNRPVTIDNFEEANKSIESIFPITDTGKVGIALRKNYGINGEAFYVYYGERGSRIILPRKYEESIKERLEVIAKLRLEKLKCQ